MMSKQAPNALRRHREEIPLPSSIVAERLGVAPPTYSRWETGMVKVSDKRKKELSEFFQVEVSDLFPYENAAVFRGKSPADYKTLAIADALWGHLAIRFKGANPGFQFDIPASALEFHHYSDYFPDFKLFNSCEGICFLINSRHVSQIIAIDDDEHTSVDGEHGEFPWYTVAFRPSNDEEAYWAGQVRVWYELGGENDRLTDFDTGNGYFCADLLEKATKHFDFDGISFAEELDYELSKVKDKGKEAKEQKNAIRADLEESRKEHLVHIEAMTKVQSCISIGLTTGERLDTDISLQSTETDNLVRQLEFGIEDHFLQVAEPDNGVYRFINKQEVEYIAIPQWYLNWMMWRMFQSE